MFERPVHIGLSPNTTRVDYVTALTSLVLPWKWKNGPEIGRVEQWFRDYFNVDTAVSFNAGRSALLAIFESLELPKHSEVLLQAFTCVALPNSVLWAGLKPVFVDIDESLNLDVADAEKKITSKTKVLLVQHTFGVPADIEKVVTFCKKHKLVLIEDCAHALGATHKGKKLGTFGDVSFFSFGRDKIVSSVFGGMAIINQKSKIKNQNLKNYYNKLSCPSYYWILQQLLHPIICATALATYNLFGLGKFILFVSQKLRLLSFPVYQVEKYGRQPADFRKRYPNALARLLLVQLQYLEQFNARRKQVAANYFDRLSRANIKLLTNDKDAVYLRFNLMTPRADELRFLAKTQSMILGNWYAHTIDPKDVSTESIGYRWGSCPRAEKAARESINLPTYPALTGQQVATICAFVLRYG